MLVSIVSVKWNTFLLRRNYSDCLFEIIIFRYFKFRSLINLLLRLVHHYVAIALTDPITVIGSRIDCSLESMILRFSKLVCAIKSSGSLQSVTYRGAFESLDIFPFLVDFHRLKVNLVRQAVGDVAHEIYCKVSAVCHRYFTQSSWFCYRQRFCYSDTWRDDRRETPFLSVFSPKWIELYRKDNMIYDCFQHFLPVIRPVLFDWICISSFSFLFFLPG